MTKLSADISIEGDMNSFFDKQSTHVTACQKRTVVKSQHSFANKWANKQFILVATYSFVNVKVFEPRFLSMYKCSVYKTNCPRINICLLRAFPVHKYKNIHYHPFIYTYTSTYLAYVPVSKKVKMAMYANILIYKRFGNLSRKFGRHRLSFWPQLAPFVPTAPQLRNILLGLTGAWIDGGLLQLLQDPLCQDASFPTMLIK